MKRLLLGLLIMAALIGTTASVGFGFEGPWYSTLQEREVRAAEAGKLARESGDQARVLDEFLQGRLADADTAYRATRTLRREVAIDVVYWDQARRRAQWAQRTQSWQGKVVARSLEEARKQSVREEWKKQALLLSQVAEGVEEAGVLFLRRALMEVEHAHLRSQEALALGERDLLIQWASDGLAREQIRGEKETHHEDLDEEVQNRDSFRSTEDFHRRKGALLPPVGAEPTHRFGPRKQDGSMSYIRHTGLTYMIDAGIDVRSVAAGVVVFADRLEGFGLLVIVDHGGGYHSLYAHLEEFSVAPGQRIGHRALVGQSGQSGSLEGPKLYFELRQNSIPVDPVEWFVRQ